MTAHRLPLRQAMRKRRALSWPVSAHTYGVDAFKGAIARGELVRVFPAVYLPQELTDDHAARASAALMWNRRIQALAGATALYLHGLARAPRTVSVQAPPGCGLRPPTGMRILMPTVPPEITRIQGLEVVSVEDAIIQSWHRGQEAEVFTALRSGATRAHLLWERAQQYPRIRHRAHFRRAVEDFLAGAESFLEAHARRTALRSVSGLQPQYTVRVGGRTYRTDLFHKRARLAIELDGRAFHGSDDDRRRDVARDAALASVGIATIRLTFEDVTQRPQWCHQTVERAIRARTPTP